MYIYKKMYYKLFNAITDATESRTKEESDELLKQAQINAEEMFINCEEKITVLKFN